MKHHYLFYSWKPISFIVVLIVLSNVAMAQVPVDTVKPKVDTMAVMKTDTVKPAPVAATTTAAATSADAGKPKHFSIYAGANSNTMSGSTEKYNANSGVGFHAGVAWEKAGFTYWQFGVRYNNAVYGFKSNITSKDTGDLKVQAIDIPLTFGVNFLSFSKLFSLRAFISAMPSFTVGVSDNHFGISKDNVNSFIFYGQLGIGVNIAILYIDLGYNYGTQSLMKNSVSATNPGQVYVSLGLRF